MVFICLFTFIFILLISSKKVKFGFFYIKRNLIPLIIICICISLVIFSSDVFHSAYSGLILWTERIVPSLLPFLICLEVLKQTNIIKVIGKVLEPITRFLFRIPGSGAFAVVMGMCSGYPVGAKFAVSLRNENQCSKIEGERLLAFTNTSGPLFIISSVGIGMFGDSKIGFILLSTHILAAILVGFIFRFYSSKKSLFDLEKMPQSAAKNKSSNTVKLSDLGKVMGDAIRSSISTLLLICGFIVFFCVLGTILDKTNITSIFSSFFAVPLSFIGVPADVLHELATGCFKGFLEVTSGLKIVSDIALDSPLLLPIAATLLGFGGLSVHMQVASIVSQSDLSMKPYFIGKGLHSLFAGVLTYLLLNYTNIFDLHALEVFNVYSDSILAKETNNINILIWSLSFLIVMTLIVLLFRKRVSDK